MWPWRRSTAARLWARCGCIRLTSPYVAPVSKSVVVGWDAQEKMWPDDDKRFSKRNVTLSDQVIHVSGNFAWEMGQEGGEAQLKGSEPTKPNNLVTNVYEKIDGRWLMVSHHAQRKSQ